MKHLFLLITLCIVSLLVVSPVSISAQGGTAEHCTPEALENILELFDTVLTDARSALEDGNIDATIDTLQTIINGIAVLRAACDDLYFEGTSTQVIGPVVFPTGMFRAVVTTDGFFIAHVTPIDDGECRFSTLGLSVSRGEATDGAEALFMSEGCTAMIETSNVTDPWTLYFERINTDTN